MFELKSSSVFSTRQQYTNHVLGFWAPSGCHLPVDEDGSRRKVLGAMHPEGQEFLLARKNAMRTTPRILMATNFGNEKRASGRKELHYRGDLCSAETARHDCRPVCSRCKPLREIQTLINLPWV